MKALDRIVELMPIPAVVALAIICMCIWLTKELRTYPSYALTLRDPFLQSVILVVGLGLLGFYGAVFIRKHSLPRTEVGRERRVFVARFDGDKENKVQRHTVESLQTLLANTGDLSHVRIYALGHLIPDNRSLRKADFEAACVVYGTYVPPKDVHYKFADPDEPTESRLHVQGFPTIDELTAQICSFVRLRRTPSPGVPVRETVSKAQYEALAQRNEALQSQIRDLRLSLKAATEGVPEAAALARLPGEVRDYYRKQRKFLLSIGVSEYARGPSLVFPRKDAEAFAKTITQCYGPTVNSTVLVDRDATRENILKTVQSIARQAKPEDQVLIYFGGHAITLPDGVGYIVPADANWEDPKQTSLSMHTLGEAFHSINAKQKIMFADACYAGSFDVFARRDMAAMVEKYRDLMNGQGEVVITAGTAKQAVMESHKVGHGLFTYFLLSGLRGSADLDRDSLVTVNELFTYLSSAVTAETQEHGVVQTPLMHAKSLTNFVLTAVDPDRAPRATPAKGSAEQSNQADGQ